MKGTVPAAGLHRGWGNAETWRGRWLPAARYSPREACAAETDSPTDCRRKEDTFTWVQHQHNAGFNPCHAWVWMWGGCWLTCWWRYTSRWWPAQTGPWSWGKETRTRGTPDPGSQDYQENTAGNDSERQREKQMLRYYYINIPNLNIY